ncbi:BrnA antitoxin family protein [Phyllobacterium myrsinacearum]|uniref:Uncharacterized protein (DUF4415 family) n=1 Tax=Phyllobacterium myrsinacearum TaxID=28101 RepID=A0A839EQ23_9HYPH|nr:BrnA antitoxin family protein [Phyllobacterium myrsinacearum]MBA8880255.1 uncharacterized protein (DUF4415 family) [Phyllobacterium myrsinacearum]
MAIKRDIQKAFQPGRGYTREDWDAVDNPELTDEEMRQMRPFREVFPEIAREIDKEIAARGRPHLEVTKMPVTLRLDPDVLAKFKATGKGWQSRINEVLKQAKVK